MSRNRYKPRVDTVLGPTRKPSVHHIVARAMSGTNNKVNKIIIPEPDHRGLHLLTKVTLFQQQMRIMYTINKPALTDEVRELTEKFLQDLNDMEFYRKGVRK